MTDTPEVELVVKSEAASVGALRRKAGKGKVAYDSGDVPLEWSSLPGSASFAVEVEWVYQNRVLVLEERQNSASRFHWDSAVEKPPSRGALELMKFSATNYKGFVDLVAKCKLGGGNEGEMELVRRERKSIAEIEAILCSLEALA